VRRPVAFIQPPVHFPGTGYQIRQYQQLIAGHNAGVQQLESQCRGASSSFILTAAQKTHHEYFDFKTNGSAYEKHVEASSYRPQETDQSLTGCRGSCTCHETIKRMEEKGKKTAEAATENVRLCSIGVELTSYGLPYDFVFFLLKKYITHHPVVPMYAAVARNTPHKCTNQCTFLEYADVFVCASTGILHHCTKMRCKNKVIAREGYVCTLTGRPVGDTDETVLPKWARFSYDDSMDGPGDREYCGAYDYDEGGAAAGDEAADLGEDDEHTGDAHAIEQEVPLSAASDSMDAASSSVNDKQPIHAAQPKPKKRKVSASAGVTRIAKAGRIETDPHLINKLELDALAIVRSVLKRDGTEWSNDDFPYDVVVKDILFLWVEIISTAHYKKHSQKYHFEIHCIVILFFIKDGFNYNGTFIIKENKTLVSGLPKFEKIPTLRKAPNHRVITGNGVRKPGEYTKAEKFFRMCFLEILTSRVDALSHLTHRMHTSVSH
jgi:hypothetical protein